MWSVHGDETSISVRWREILSLFFTTHNTWGYKELCFFPFYVTIRVKNCILLLFTSRVLFCIGCFPLCITLRRDVCSDFGRNFEIAAGTTMVIRLLLSP
jgi:hypothetical protein